MAFFRSEEKKRPLVAFGANVVFRNAATGQARAIHLLNELQKSGTRVNLIMKALAVMVIVALVGVGGYWGYTQFLSGKSFNMSKLLPGPSSPEMKFYREMFPDLYGWLESEQPDQKEIAESLLKPEFITDLMKGMDQEFYKDEESDESFKGNRLILFTYFNYNTQVKETLKAYQYKLGDTEFGRLARIYSCDTSGYASNIFYFKVGDLDIKRPRINQFLTENMISYTDYKRLRDTQGFSDMLKNDSISYQLKKVLSEVYTFSPMKVAAPLDEIDWYLLVRRGSGGKVNFAAFFKRGESTMIPREISSRLMRTPQPAPHLTATTEEGGHMKSAATATANEIETNESSAPKPETLAHANIEGFTWYAIDDDQKRALHLRQSAIGYFTEKIGQTFKLEVIGRKIEELSLKPIQGHFPIAIHQELLMEDSKGKYGIQCYDPITALVLSNVIDKSSFEESSNVSLKRDPIQINTSLVQLSKG